MSAPRSSLPSLPAGVTESAAAELLTAEDRQRLDRVAGYLKKKGLALPAMMFLESVRPLNFLASGALTFSLPLASLFMRDASMGDRLAEMLERRDSIDYLIALLDHDGQDARSAGEGRSSPK